MEMGKLYYAEKGDAPDAAYAALCEKVTASKSVIAANKVRMQELKSESGDTEVSEAVDAEIVDAEVVEDGEDCADVLIQLSAVKSEINNTGKLILKQHMEHCIVEAVRENDQSSIDKMNEAIDRFMK